MTDESEATTACSGRVPYDTHPYNFSLLCRSYWMALFWRWPYSSQLISTHTAENETDRRNIAHRCINLSRH